MSGDYRKTMKGLHVKSPLIENLFCRSYSEGRPVYLKLDNNQPGGSFKIRGIGRLCQLVKEQGYEEIVCPSGGNAGIACAYAARVLNLRATIVIFNIASDEVKSRIEMEGAKVIRYGDTSDEAINYAKSLAEVSEKCKFIHPFDEPNVWEGNSSLVDELYEDLNGVQPSMIVTCCGGGGLFCGIMKGLQRYQWQSTGVLVMETTGSGSFNAMIRNDYKPITIRCDNTLAKTLTSVIVCQEAANYAADKRFNVFSDLVSDETAMEACLLLADHQRIMVELSCGTVLGALYTGMVSRLLRKNPKLPESGPVVMIVCGGNDVKLEQMEEWAKRIGRKNRD